MEVTHKTLEQFSIDL